MIIILAGMITFIILNLLITVFLCYYNGNDGWLEYYHTIAKKQHGAS